MPAALVLALAVAAGCARHASGPPALRTSFAATFVGGEVTLDGAHLGAAGTDAAIVLDARTIPSTDPAVLEWSASRVRFVLAAADTSAHVSLATARGATATIPLEVYSLDAFAIPVTAQTNDGVLALALDASAHTLWLDEEYQRDELKGLATSSGAWTVVPIPSPPDPGPFATKTVCGDCRTQISELGEDVRLDDAGNVWISQGGGLLYDLANPNHSRIVRFTPATGALRVYDLPGDHNEVTGLAWDAARGRLWYAQAGIGQAAIGSIDPDAVAYHDGTFDFSTPVVWSAPGAELFPLPLGDEYPTQLAIDPDGRVWYSAYLRGWIGRLDPATGAVEHFALPPKRAANPNALSPGPWTLLRTPDALVFDEQFDSQIGRLDLSGCQAPGSCAMTFVDIPDADLVQEFAGLLASAPDGRIWYSVSLQPGAVSSGGTVGFVTPDFSAIARLPPLPPTGGALPPSASGIAIDAASGDVWVGDYTGHRLFRLHRR